MSAGGSNRMLTVAEVAERLAVQPKTIYENWRAWGMKAHRIGDKALRFRERDIEAWLESHTA